MMGNIGPAGARRRTITAAVLTVLIAAAGGALFGRPRVWRLGLFPLFWVLGLLVFQLRAKT